MSQANSLWWISTMPPPGWAGTRKVKPIWILLKQETVSGSGTSRAICKSASRSRQITMPVPHHSSFLQTGCPSCHPTNSVKALFWVTVLINKKTGQNITPANLWQAGVTTKTKLSLRKGIMPHEYICLVSEMGMTQTSRNCAHQHSYQLVVHTELMATILSSLWVPSMLVCAIKPINSSTGKIQKNN